MAGTAIGNEWGRSIALPTSGTFVRGNDLLYGNAGTRKWKKATNAPAQVLGVAGTAVSDNAFRIQSDLFNSSYFGIWVKSFINDDEQGAIMLPWGIVLAPAPVSDDDPMDRDANAMIRDVVLPVKKTTPARRAGMFFDTKVVTIRASLYLEGLFTLAVHYLDIKGQHAASPLPDEHTTIRIYPALIGGVPNFQINGVEQTGVDTINFNAP